ncbi:MAG: HAD hydrolase-like protein, partial [Tannerella sp.]|nr:HAD hydrolase-like protein [Tannerella sp.]
MNTIKQAIQSYLSDKNYQRIALKAMLFDMDGVLYDSMPSHAKAWNSTMKAHGINLSFEDAYLHEGRTGADTIHIICRREGIELPEEKVAAIYQEKVKVFENMPTPEPMKGSYELLQKVVRDGLSPMVVTGSGQPSLIDKLNVHFPHIFQR